MGLPAAKPDAIPTIFPKSIDRFEPPGSTSKAPRPAFEKRQQKSVSYNNLM